MNDTLDQIMHTKLSAWPAPLIEYVQFCQRYVGFSGGMLSDCAEEWIDAGQPENVCELKLSFLMRVHPAPAPAPTGGPTDER